MGEGKVTVGWWTPPWVDLFCIPRGALSISQALPESSGANSSKPAPLSRAGGEGNAEGKSAAGCERTANIEIARAEGASAKVTFQSRYEATCVQQHRISCFSLRIGSQTSRGVEGGEEVAASFDASLTPTKWRNQQELFTISTTDRDLTANHYTAVDDG